MICHNRANKNNSSEYIIALLTLTATITLTRIATTATAIIQIIQTIIIQTIITQTIIIQIVAISTNKNLNFKQSQTKKNLEKKLSSKRTLLLNLLKK